MKNTSQREYLASVWHKQKDIQHIHMQVYILTYMHIQAGVCAQMLPHTVVRTLSSVVL